MTDHGGPPGRSDLTAQQRELLARLIRGEAPEAVGSEAGPVAEGTAPLSFAQRRLWFLEQLAPGTPAYNLPLALRLSGPLDLAALRQTLAQIIRRHEPLRTTFAGGPDGEPCQTVQPATGPDLPLTDLSAMPEEAELRRQASAEAQRPFDLTRGPLLRCHLWRLAPEDHLLLLTMHHIVSDGWSGSVLLAELTALYPALARGERRMLPSLPVPYREFAARQRQSLAGQRLEELRAWWRQELAGELPVLSLPTDRPRPPVMTAAGSEVRFALEPGVTAALQTLSRSCRATLYMTLLAAWAALLQRYTGQAEFLIGTPVAGRPERETEGLIGLFVGTLVLRVSLQGSPSFRDLVDRVRETVLGALTHQEFPFELLVEELAPRRDPSRSPLFQTMFNHQRLPSRTVALGPALTASPFILDAVQANFDLTLEISEGADGVQGALVYNIDLWEAGTAAAMAGGYQTLLAAAVAAPDLPVERLLLSAPAGLQAWSRTPAPHCIHVQFAEQAARTPDAVALVAGQCRLTYRELNEQADALAARLRAAGVGPDRVVGLCLERSPELLVAMLAVLKAGGGYLPLDPADPPERRAFLLEDSRAVVTITADGLTGPLSPAAEEEAEPGNLAYVIYTSGSTGTPKGVAVTHRNLANHCAGFVWLCGLTAGDRVLQFSSPSFDVAGEEIYPTLLAGATLVQAPPGTLSFPDLQRLLQEQGVTVVDLPAAYWHEWVAHLSRSGAALPPSLRLVLTGSEQVSPERYALWRSLPGTEAIRWLNAYGPTEATITATVWEPAGPAPAGWARLPIGHPLPGAEAYILDRYLEPVLPGGLGELYIGGEGVARGYVGRPDLTAERFIPDPFSGAPGALRLYRTGDLARFRPDGTIDFLGRLDQQVKVRGYRIELGEIEAALRQHPAVTAAAVEARGEGDARRLIAYVVAGDASPADLRRHLAGWLAPYMVPATFVTLKELPLTAGGKVNRRALPDPPMTPDGEATAPPATGLERTIAAIWQEVLGAPRVGAEENFFDLGGHSLRLLQVHGRLREALGRDVPLVELFRHPTVRSLAAYLSEGDSESPVLDAARDRARRQQEALMQQQRQMQERRRRQEHRGQP